MKKDFISLRNFAPAPGEAASPATAWKEDGNRLYRKFTFKDFSAAFAFMTRVALEAQTMDHHPLWTNSYNVVEIWLSSHDAGDIVTEKDHRLSKKIDALLG